MKMPQSTAGTIMSALLMLSTLAIPAQADMPGAASYVVSTAFPTSVFSSYYVKPAPTQEPQPALYDAVLNITYPLNLTDPSTIPTADNDPVVYPQALANFTNATIDTLMKSALAEIRTNISDNGTSNCTKCLAALSVGKMVAKLAPSHLPDAMVQLCQVTKFASNATCLAEYAAGSYGAIWTQILALADVTGLDGQYICNSLSGTFCPAPTSTPLNMTGLFPKPKPANAKAPKPSGKRVKVLHLSDFHLDPRYEVASEANCTSGLCCRHNESAVSYSHPHGYSKSPSTIFPAPLYGAFK
jgi:hypothetical protein